MFVSHPLVRDGKLELRRYQEAVIARAVEASTLVVLPTGLGKTVIAAMVAAHRLMAYPGSKVLLLAPTKPLVVQHMRTFKELLTAKEMCVLTGEDAPEKRRKSWDASRIVFATPQTIQNDMVRGISVKDVSLIIFDEAHRAVGDYSYVTIAQQYLKAARNPMTLGLTASPSSEKQKVHEICSNLGIKYVEAKSDSDADVKPYIQSVRVNWVRVDLPEKFTQVQKLMQAVLKEQLQALKKLGYLGTADQTRINKRVLLEIQHKVRGEITAGGEAFTAASVVAAAIKVNHGIELLETQGIAALDEYFDRMRTQQSKAVGFLMKDLALQKAIHLVRQMRKDGIEHPKIDELVRIVSKYKGRKVLVFTQYRDSVDMIIRRLNEADILTHEFIGQASHGLKDGMSQKRQIEVLDKFRDGAYTALIATSVAEEGLDIPKVDAVVFYEPVPSEIRTIQRRGRTGRSEAGEVYVLIARGTRDEAYYWSSVHKERRMGNIVKEMRKGLIEQKNLEETNGAETITTQDNAIPLSEAVKEFTETRVGFGQQTLTSYDWGSTGRLKVIVDVRERSQRIISSIKESAKVELKQLPVGDFLVSDRVCIERKTVADFIGSIIDRRLMSQMSEMTRNFQTPIIILEGKDSLFSQRNIHPNAVRGALAAVAADFNIPIIPSESEEETAALIIALAKREQEENQRPVALRGERKPQFLHERQRFVVESLPHVSAVLADRLLRRFGSIESLMNATQKEMREVDGIGEKKALQIRKVIKSAYERYNVEHEI